ncbi:MBL fold metallo-hydrolase [Nocardioides cheoyonin]|uniref:MBL fold metallo-hydrolase n=1 Tax=Nocardioides cheoyonin TaxID=3156615 RepID=UPI0032B5971E
MRITEVTPQVYAVAGTAVNWTVLRDGDDLTLVDGGYPGDLPEVLESLAEVGGTLRAVLLTHAHIDHLGGLPGLLTTYDVPVHASATEAAHARREFLEQAGPADIARIAWRPRAWPWIRELLSNGALRDRQVPRTTEFPRAADGPLDVPGSPVPVPTPGHTSGHTAYLVERVLLTGDALVTGHPLSGVRGPQRIASFFHHDLEQAERALDTIAGVEADVLVPGHGPVHHGSPAAAVATARAR